MGELLWALQQSHDHVGSSSVENVSYVHRKNYLNGDKMYGILLGSVDADEA
jgi:hypothetical protein